MHPACARPRGARTRGWKRDVGLALTGPLEDVSQFLFLDQPSKLVKAAIGRSDDDKIGDEV